VAAYGPTTYGDSWADIYDAPFLGWPDATDAARFLAARANGGPALELGVGTGRVAIPLTRLGVAVVGVDASAEMLRVLHAKPEGDLVVTHCATFEEYRDTASYPLIYMFGLSFLQLPE
jgi:2-polyprenyl-3-methyl-5-hydroxy-6-metoxy-1,4-benzoquinol methylase